jgi:hypothetical protein
MDRAKSSAQPKELEGKEKLYPRYNLLACLLYFCGNKYSFILMWFGLENTVERK